MAFETVPANDRVSGPYVATAGQTVFLFDFPAYQTSEIAVSRTRAGIVSTLALGNDCTISINANGSGGSVTLLTGALAGDVIVIAGQTSQGRETAFDPRGDFTATEVNRQLNRLHMLAQENARDIGSTLRAPMGELLPPLPPASARANKVLTFDGQGNVLLQAILGFGSEFGRMWSNLMDAAAGRVALGLHVVDANVFEYNVDTTIPEAINFHNGGIIRANNCTVTITGAFDAPARPVFEIIGTGKIVFADGAVPEIRPEWWGFSASASGAVNSAAVQRARDSITLRGVVKFPSGAFLWGFPVYINRSFIRFEGGSRFGTALVCAANVACGGIDGTAAPNYVEGVSGQIDECSWIDIAPFCYESSSANVSSDANGAVTAMPTGTIGLLHRMAANSQIRAKPTNFPIGYLESRTSGARVEVYAVRGPLAGDSAATKWVGVLSDCVTAAPAGTSSNGSSLKDTTANGLGFAGESWGIVMYGADFRDQFWTLAETAHTSHAMQIIGTVDVQCFDFHLDKAILDTWTKSGFIVYNIPAGSCMNIYGGYSAPKIAGASVGPSVLLANASGVNIDESFEAKGGINFSFAIAVMMKNCTDCRVEPSVRGCVKGVVVDGGAFNRVGCQAICFPTQFMNTAIEVNNGSSRNFVSGFVVRGGLATITNGITIDASSGFNKIGPGLMGPGDVTNQIVINGAAVTAAGTYGNSNVVVPGALS